MKKILPVLLLIPLLGSSCGPTGFLGTGLFKSSTVQDPRATVAQMADAYTGVVNEIVTLRNNGTIQRGSSVDQALKIADNKAYAALKDAQNAVNSGQPLTQVLIDAFNNALADVKIKKADATR